VCTRDLQSACCRLRATAGEVLTGRATAGEVLTGCSWRQQPPGGGIPCKGALPGTAAAVYKQRGADPGSKPRSPSLNLFASDWLLFFSRQRHHILRHWSRRCLPRCQLRLLPTSTVASTYSAPVSTLSAAARPPERALN
jgi:hypothetical protein